MNSIAKNIFEYIFVRTILSVDNIVRWLFANLNLFKIFINEAQFLTLKPWDILRIEKKREEAFSLSINI